MTEEANTDDWDQPAPARTPTQVIDRARYILARYKESKGERGVYPPEVLASQLRRVTDSLESVMEGLYFCYVHLGLNTGGAQNARELFGPRTKITHPAGWIAQLIREQRAEREREEAADRPLPNTHPTPPKSARAQLMEALHPGYETEISPAQKREWDKHVDELVAQAAEQFSDIIPPEKFGIRVSEPAPAVLPNVHEPKFGVNRQALMDSLHPEYAELSPDAQAALDASLDRRIERIVAEMGKPTTTSTEPSDPEMAPVKVVDPPSAGPRQTLGEQLGFEPLTPKHSNGRVEAAIQNAERYIAKHDDDVAPGVGSREVGIMRTLIDALMRTDPGTLPTLVDGEWMPPAFPFVVSPEGGQWSHCTPALISRPGFNCGATLRRSCQCPTGGSHDHYVADEPATHDPHTVEPPC